MMGEIDRGRRLRAARVDEPVAAHRPPPSGSTTVIRPRVRWGVAVSCHRAPRQIAEVGQRRASASSARKFLDQPTDCRGVRARGSEIGTDGALSTPTTRPRPEFVANSSVRVRSTRPATRASSRSDSSRPIVAAAAAEARSGPIPARTRPCRTPTDSSRSGIPADHQPPRLRRPRTSSRGPVPTAAQEWSAPSTQLRADLLQLLTAEMLTHLPEPLVLLLLLNEVSARSKTVHPAAAGRRRWGGDARGPRRSRADAHREGDRPHPGLVLAEDGDGVIARPVARTISWGTRSGRILRPPWGCRARAETSALAAFGPLSGSRGECPTGFATGSGPSHRHDRPHPWVTQVQPAPHEDADVDREQGDGGDRLLGEHIGGDRSAEVSGEQHGTED